MQPPRGPLREQGLTLVEVLVAAAIAAITMAGGYRITAAASDARSGAALLLESLERSESQVELLRVISERDSELEEVTIGDVALTWPSARCRPSPSWRRALVGVTGSDGAQAGVLVAAVPVGGPGSQVVALRDPDGRGLAGAEVELVATDGVVTVLTADDDGCVVIPGGVDGLVATGGSSPGIPVVIAGGPEVVDVVVPPDGWLQVDVASAGRRPDRVADGLLAWWPPDLPDPTPSEPSEGRPVPAGPHRVVVGMCADARAGGSVATAAVPPHGAVSVVVTLGTVAVAADLGGEGVEVLLVRGRPCPGSGARSRLAWDHGGGGGPLLAAVPDGVWELRVVGGDGRLLAGPTEVLVGGPGVTG